MSRSDADALKAPEIIFHSRAGVIAKVGTAHTLGRLTRSLRLIGLAENLNGRCIFVPTRAREGTHHVGLVFEAFKTSNIYEQGLERGDCRSALS